MFGEQVVHDGGAFDDKTGNVLQRVMADETDVSNDSLEQNRFKKNNFTLIPGPGHCEKPVPPPVHAGISI